MKRLLPLCALLVCGLGLVATPVMASNKHLPNNLKPPPRNFAAHFSGRVIMLNPAAGFEPDFDRIARTVIEAKVTTHSGLHMTLILDAYIESFQSDTQPVLPDLINVKHLLNTTLGGFFTGRAIMLGPGNKVLYDGTMLAEALIRPICIVQQNNPVCRGPETQHMILVDMFGKGAAKGGSMRLDSSFLTWPKSFKVAGSLYGNAKVPPAAQKLLRGKPGHLSPKRVLHDFHVSRPPMMGTAGNGRPSSGTCVLHHCTNVGKSGRPTGAGHQRGSNSNPGSRQQNPTGQSSARPAWMAPLGGALIGLAVLLLIVFFWQQRKERPSSSSAS